MNKKELKEYLEADLGRFGCTPTLKDRILHNEVWDKDQMREALLSYLK